MKGLTQLESLNLEHNRLQHIAVQACMHVPGLKQLTLSHNRLSLRGPLTDIGEVQSVLNACLKLEELYIRNNSITTIFSDWVLTLANLQTLDLSHNIISSLAVSMQDFMFPSSVLRIWVFWDVILCCWVNASKVSRRMSPSFSSQGVQEETSHSTLEDEGDTFQCKETQHNISEDLNCYCK